MQPIKTLTALLCLASLSYPIISGAEDLSTVVPSTTQVPSDLDLQDARSRFLIWVGEPAKGIKRLDEALSRDSDNVELQIVKADIDFRLGRKVAAYDRISKLMRRASDNPDVRKMYAIIKSAMSSSVSLGWSFDRPANNSLERFENLKVEYVVTMNHRVGLRLASTDLSTPSIVSSDNGSVKHFTGSKSNTVLYYRYLAMNGDEIGGELQANQEHIAIKGDYKKWRPWGFHSLSAMTNQVYWGTREAIANEYRRDGLLYENDYYIGYDLQSHWGLGLYRYHSKYQGNIAKSDWYHLSLDYKVPERFTEKYLKHYHVNVHYSVRGELFSEISQVNNGSGEYQPFSTMDREVHTLTADIPWTSSNDEYRVVPFIGGANNSHGTHGVVFGVNATYHYGTQYDIGFNLSHDFIGDNNYIGNIAMMTASVRF